MKDYLARSPEVLVSWQTDHFIYRVRIVQVALKWSCLSPIDSIQHSPLLSAVADVD